MRGARSTEIAAVQKIRGSRSLIFDSHRRLSIRSILFDIGIARWRGVIMVKSVLVVDDNPIVRSALCELLAREGDFDVCGEAENGREAIERARQLCPDLVVTDLSMPIMNGIEEARLLKQLMPAVPVIIYTAHSDPFIEKEARSAGASAVISKSEAVATLIAKARSLFDQMAA